MIHLNADTFLQLGFVLAYCYFSEAECTKVTFQRIILEDQGSIPILDNFSNIFQSAQKIQPNPDIALLFSAICVGVSRVAVNRSTV